MNWEFNHFWVWFFNLSRVSFPMNLNKAKLIAVNISTGKGTPKKNVGKGMLIEGHGLEGDAHAGKWHRQISLLGKDTLDKMDGKVPYGGFGENLTIDGICVYELPVGTKLKINNALLEVTQIGKECHESCEIMKIM